LFALLTILYVLNSPIFTKKTSSNKLLVQHKITVTRLDNVEMFVRVDPGSFKSSVMVLDHGWKVFYRPTLCRPIALFSVEILPISTTVCLNFVIFVYYDKTGTYSDVVQKTKVTLPSKCSDFDSLPVVGPTSLSNKLETRCMHALS